MSFCNSNGADKCPGNISGNPMNGLCEKVCIQARKVFDACISQTTLEALSVTLTDLDPASSRRTPHFRRRQINLFKRHHHRTHGHSPLGQTGGFPECWRRSPSPCRSPTPTPTASKGSGTGTVTLTQDVVMCVPTGSVFPVELAATVNMASPNGTYVSGTTFSITACTTVVMKVLADTLR